MAAYQSMREAEASRQTAELECRCAMLRRVLADGIALPPLHPAQLRAAAPMVPFDPGALAHPVLMPDPGRYQVPPLSGVQSLRPAARREHADLVARARDRYEHDWRTAQAAEAERLRQVADLHQRHQAWLSAVREQTEQRNAWVDALPQRLRAGETDAVGEYFTAVLSIGAGWPAEFPRGVVAEWDGDTRQLIVEWQLPGFETVPEATRIRYVKSSDEYKPIAMPVGQRAGLYREALCQSALRVIAEVFRVDHLGQVASVVFNGYVIAGDPATGQDTERFLITTMVRREDLDGVRLGEVDAVACLRHLRAQVSARPERLDQVRPGRRVRPGTDPAGPDPDGGPDLHEMAPERFEHLVGDLFRSRGLQVVNTAGSGDGGVDVEARDPDPITGGLIVIQVKRYRATVAPSVVRDLYGVVQHRGAIKGILVTTSGFGPGTYEFAEGKPLTLINGTELADLLARAGIAQ
ncbi:restriction endonuclease [Actinoplanes couchii]|uniref:Restriction endonuclease n=1 Tax=Actinoplanes couchii TaxID=403638 RepID=A0ABQ3XR99_9ACTN|nr:restriction endonuclease [Actinoplanes couchii]MDR6318233.1 hypothetical protein [Actinoplanes couchii]GID61028.1 restriction endonuclease [Actinoplanes couchii]